MGGTVTSTFKWQVSQHRDELACRCQNYDNIKAALLASDDRHVRNAGKTYWSLQKEKGVWSMQLSWEDSPDGLLMTKTLKKYWRSLTPNDSYNNSQSKHKSLYGRRSQILSSKFATWQSLGHWLKQLGQSSETKERRIKTQAGPSIQVPTS